MGRAAAVWLLLLVGTASTPEPQAKITAIEARLFDPDKGEFTADVLEDGLFVGWNTFMREGNGGYGRGDALVLVRLQLPNRDGRNFIIDGPLTITAQKSGKLLARRRFTQITLLNGNEVNRALYLQDIGCAGDVIVRAELGGQTKTARLHLECGE